MKEIILDDSVNDQLPTSDSVGNIAYEEGFRHHRTLQLLSGSLLVALLVSVGANVLQSRRPPVVIVDRVDEAGHAEATLYSGLNYTPREAEIRARLNDWAIDRYRLLKTVASEKFKLNYAYLSAALAQQLMQPDAVRLAKILAGNEPEQDVVIDNIRFTSLRNESSQSGAAASGEAVIEMTRTVSASDPPERQHWTVNLRYEVDPIGAAKRGESDPEFLNVNPLGVTITWFHEDRAFR